MSAPKHPAYETVREVTPCASVVLCHNPGTMELDGTNTWILRAPGHTDCVVVDPGPKGHRNHLDSVGAVGNIALTLITHRHRDHTGAITKFHSMTGTPVRALRDKYCRDGAPLVDREIIEAAGLRITVIATPGHTRDSVSFLIENPHHPEDTAICTGDTILGTGTTVLDPADGTLRDYLHSLNRIIVDAGGATLLPGHGPDHPDVEPIARYYKQHREERIDQIRAALAALNTTAHAVKPKQIVRTVYADVDKKLWLAAKMSVKAQLAYLRGE